MPVLADGASRASVTTIMSYRTRILLVAAVLLVVVVWAWLHFRTQPQWQRFSAEEFWNSLKQAKQSYLLLGACLTFASYLGRAFRWRAFLRPLKTASLWNIFSSTVIGFSAVALASRAGEIVRPWLIARKEELPLSSQLGAWTLERVFDSLMLVALLGVALWFVPAAVAQEGVSAALLASFRSAGAAFTVLAVMLAGLMAQLRYFPRFTAAVVGFFARPLPERYRTGLQQMLEHFSATIAVIENSRRFLGCIGWTALVWGTLWGAYWSAALALGPPLSSLPASAMVLLMAASVTGSLFYVPGIGGGTQVAMMLTLTELFGVPLTFATSLALVIWVMTFLLVLLPGVPLAAREGLSWRSLQRLVRGQEKSPSPEAGL
jgi:uncharacterized protein (TIRG00374 family)